MIKIPSLLQAILITLLFSVATAGRCSHHTNCDECTKDILCQWCGKEYFSPSGHKSHCHVFGSPYGCLSWIRECGSPAPLTNDTIGLPITSPEPLASPSIHPSDANNDVIEPAPISFHSPRPHPSDHGTSHPIIIVPGSPSPSPSYDPVANVFASPWRSRSVSSSVSVSASPAPSPSVSMSISPSESRSSSSSPSESRSISPSPSVSKSAEASVSPSVSVSESSSISRSPSASRSESASVSKSPSISISPSITPSASLVCAAYYYTDCQRKHPGCRHGFTEIDVYTMLESVDSNGWRQSMCLWPLTSHWKCCMNMPRIEPVDSNEDKLRNSAKPHRTPVAEFIAPLSIFFVLLLATVVHMRMSRRQASLASQDATIQNYNGDQSQLREPEP